MTLCMAWRNKGTVHFASDSRLTVASNSTVDVAIKVLCIPYQVLHPGYGNNPAPPQIAWTGELGMCFAGSAVNSMFIKESLVEILRRLQHAPGYTDTSMFGMMRYVFSVYREISNQVCATVLGSKGRADLLVGGRCADTSKVRVFQLSTDSNNKSSLAEVLAAEGDHVFIGSGSSDADQHLPANPSDRDYLKVLKSVIDDVGVPSVGGNIQYGCFEGKSFRVFGIAELGKRVHYWRGAIDLNSDELMRDDNFVPGITHIDPFNSFAD